ncbi:hypothetical protein C8F01DRAFT_1370422 [Mycena amicta]|nr:hypothetical protein C8F01DRAFT_1370422 [Mycena amicta]
MALSFTVADHGANPVFLRSQIVDGYRAEQFLKDNLRFRGAERVGDVLQFGLRGRMNYIATARFPFVAPQSNGFVHTVFTAYSQHHQLIIRPDDVWLSILSQFNFFGRKSSSSSRSPATLAKWPRAMASLIHDNVVDPHLGDWALPNFTTTTETDRTAASIMLMSTLAEYFEYEFVMICGIPRITIEGTREDWVLIVQRLEKLKEYGVETIAWYHLLRPVIARFVDAFDPVERGKPEHRDFWRNIAHHTPPRFGCAGEDYLSGWLNAFNAFNEEGKWLGNELRTNLAPTSAPPPSNFSAAEFWRAHLVNAGPSLDDEVIESDLLTIDGTPFHKLDLTAIPPGFASVDVLLRAPGQQDKPCAMLAGVVGSEISASARDIERDTVRPVVGWWMYEKKDERPHRYAADREEL